MDSEETGVKVVFWLTHFRTHLIFFIPDINPPPQNPLQSCMSPGLISGILQYTNAVYPESK